MDKKTTGLIATIATALLCGCPGLFGLCMGAMFAVVGGIPGSDIDIGGSNSPAAAIGTGVALLCVGLIFTAIPIVVGFVTLRKKPQELAPIATESAVSEPQPPTSTDATVISLPKPPAPPTDDEPLPPAS